MKTVRVNTNDLTEKLKANREKHQAEYEEALSAYKVAFAEEVSKKRKKAHIFVERNCERLLEAIAKNDAEELRNQKISEDSWVGLERPKNYTEDYDRAIDMLEWEQAEFIDIREDDFRKFVRDEWDWIREFKNINKSYTDPD